MADYSGGDQHHHQQQLLNGDADVGMDRSVASTSMEERPSTPDRPNFERLLSELNETINKCHQELNSLLGKHGMESEWRKLIGQMRESKQLRDAEKFAARKLDPEIENLRREVNEKGKIISELDNSDLIYKKEDRLDAKMKELEDRYNSKR
uniref:Uncharacterized protein n=1 Tax=Plectus sambesii TaxID=2011161 RepID=A0A914V929_9BILA